MNRGARSEQEIEDLLNEVREGIKQKYERQVERALEELRQEIEWLRNMTGFGKPEAAEGQRVAIHLRDYLRNKMLTVYATAVTFEMENGMTFEVEGFERKRDKLPGLVLRATQGQLVVYPEFANQVTINVKPF